MYLSAMATPRGEIITLNVSSYGPLQKYLGTLEKEPAQIVMVQEHHALNYKLGEVQAAARDEGWHGVWLPAQATAGGTSAGVAVLSRHGVTITQAPRCENGELYPHRVVAAQVN